MKHRVCTAAFLCVALLLSACAAWASVPSLANSTVPTGIQLVGSTGGTPDAKGEAVVIVRDAGNNNLPGVTVYLEFENCMGPSQPNKDMFIKYISNRISPSVHTNDTIFSNVTDRPNLVYYNTD